MGIEQLPPVHRTWEITAWYGGSDGRFYMSVIWVPVQSCSLLATPLHITSFPPRLLVLSGCLQSQPSALPPGPSPLLAREPL